MTEFSRLYTIVLRFSSLPRGGEWSDDASRKEEDGLKKKIIYSLWRNVLDKKFHTILLVVNFPFCIEGGEWSDDARRKEENWLKKKFYIVYDWIF